MAALPEKIGHAKVAVLNMGSYQHVAVWIHHGLGDVIMALPMLTALDRQLPHGSRLTLLVKSTSEEQLLRLVCWRSHVSYINLGHYGSWNYWGVFRVGLLLRKQRPDIFMAPHASGGPLPPLFARLVGTPIAVGPEGCWSRLGFSHVVRCLAGQHKVKYYANFASSIELIDGIDIHVPLNISAEQKRSSAKFFESPEEIDGQWIIVAPGSSPVELHKRWPHIRYRELIARLTREYSDVHIALLGSPGEISLLEGIASGLEADRIRIIAQPDIEVTLALLQQAMLVVCGCTGAGHLAMLAGTSIVGLYGPTNPSFTGPFTPMLRLVRKNYSCSPCYRPGFEKGCGNPVCMTDITVDQVLDSIRDTLRGSPIPELPRLVATNAQHPQPEATAR